MDDGIRKRSSHGTQIDDLPSCLIIDILSRLRTRSLLSCRVVCKSWNLVFSDPMFVELHRARSATHLIRQRPPYYRICGKVTSPDYEFSCVNSSNGLLCLENCKSGDEIYVCNPILGEYITIPTGNTDAETKRRRVKSVLGFSSRSNQYKILHIKSPGYIAEIYTIGDGTRRWKSVGIAPSYPKFYGDDSVHSFVNGSVHWLDRAARQVFYFNFDTERFGSLPLPPGWPEGIWPAIMRLGVLEGCLCFYAGYPLYQHLVMKEYGVKESWIITYDPPPVFYSHYTNSLRIQQFGVLGAAPYNPSFISLQDIAKGEQFTVLSRTRATEGRSESLSDYLRLRHHGVRKYKYLGHV